ncbi:unnamed protein product [Lepidochelys kempii]
MAPIELFALDTGEQEGEILRRAEDLKSWGVCHRLRAAGSKGLVQFLCDGSANNMQEFLPAGLEGFSSNIWSIQSVPQIIHLSTINNQSRDERESCRFHNKESNSRLGDGERGCRCFFGIPLSLDFVGHFCFSGTPANIFFRSARGGFTSPDFLFGHQVQLNAKSQSQPGLWVL